MPEINLDQKHPLSREVFFQAATRLLLTAAGLLGLGGLIRFFSHQPQIEKPDRFDLGPEHAFPESGKCIRLDIPGLIYRENDAYLALSLTCTHLGCVLEEAGNSLVCPRHGSEYTKSGKLIKGPAEEDLLPLKVEVNPEGHIIVDASEKTQ